MLILRVGHMPICGKQDTPLFRRHDFSIEHVDLGRDIQEFLRLYDYDIVLIDMELPDILGDEVVRQMRAEGITTPCIVLANVAAPAIRARALNRGADDFVITPCHPEELLARMRAVVRRSRGHANSVLRAGSVELSLHRHEVLVEGKKVTLSRREFGALELLFLKRGVVLSKDAFLNHLYTGTNEPEIKALDVIFCRLRKKLAVAGVPDLIETVWGVGYILRDPPGIRRSAAVDQMAEASP